MTSRLLELEDDGLMTPEVGDYAEEKYRLIGLYAELFAKAMKGKWDSRVYIDLYLAQVAPASKTPTRYSLPHH